jgi:hypothetical protein
VLPRPTRAKLHGLTEAKVDCLLVELTANGYWRCTLGLTPAGGMRSGFAMR